MPAVASGQALVRPPRLELNAVSQTVFLPDNRTRCYRYAIEGDNPPGGRSVPMTTQGARLMGIFDSQIAFGQSRALGSCQVALSAEHSRRRLAECAAMHGHSEGPPVDRKTSTTFRSAVSFAPPEPNRPLGRSPCLLSRAANGVDDRGRERCPRPSGCCAFGRRHSAVMSGARASDIPDGAASATCLVLSQARHSPAFEQCQESRGTGKVPGYC